MKQLLFSLRDSVAEYYMNPIFARTRAEAIRSLGMAVQGEGDIARHAEHFTLFELGTFDPMTGLLGLHNAPVYVIGAWELKPASLPELVSNG